MSEMMSALIVGRLLLLVATFGVYTAEWWLLQQIFQHPAGTPRDVPTEYLIAAALPLLAVGFSVWNRLPLKVRSPEARAIAYCWLFGLIFVWLALVQYSHSTPGLMLIGYVLQWVVFFRLLWRLVHVRPKTQPK
jgi:hypothetical protein